MSKSTTRNETLEAILAAVPPRASEADRARANLERLDEAVLRELHANLVAASGVRIDAPKVPVDQARRVEARQKIALGLTQLTEVGRRIDAAKRSRETERAKSSEPVAVARRRRPTAMPIAAEARLRQVGRKIDYTASSWAWPLLLDSLAISHAVGEKFALRSKLKMILTDASIVAIEDNFIAVDPLRDVLSKQIEKVFERSTLEARAAREVAELVVSSLDEPAMSKYLEIHFASMVRDVVAMTIDGTGIKPDVSSTWRSRHFAALEHLKLHHLRVSPPVAEPTFLSDEPSLLPDTVAVDGFAKMVIRTREFDPTEVLFVQGGGQMAGELVRHASPWKVRKGVYDPRQGTVVETSKRKTAGDVRILVIDDISRSGKTLEQALSRLHQAYGGASVRVMALVGTVASARRLGGPAFFPTLSPDPEVDVPWDREGTYRATEENHVLGYGKQDTLSISKNMLERAIDRLDRFND